MLSWGRLAAWVLALGLPCCSPERLSAPQLGDCEGQLCRPAQGGGAAPPVEASAPPPGDASDDGAPAPVSLAVTTTVNTGFADVQPYNAPVLINAESEDGRRFSSGDTPLSAPVSMQVPRGRTWFSVIGSGPVRIVAPTLQSVVVDGLEPAIPLRALAWDAIISLFVDNQPWAPQAATATVFMVFRRAGAPLRGVAVQPLVGTSVAYFESENRYTTEGSTAAFESTVLVRDIGRLAPYPTLTSITVQYQVGAATVLLPIRVAPDFVTWMNVDVP